MTRLATPARHRRIRPSRSPLRDGWGWLVVSAASRAYLVFVACLAAIALLPALAGWNATVVQSGSMEPHISAGDIVLTAPLADDEPVPLGRVVSFRSGADAEADGVEKIRLHRIVTPNDDGTFVTAGDANRDVDSVALSRDQIIGQGRLLVSFIGLPSLWVGTGNIAALALWLTLTGLALACVWFDRRTDTDDEPDSSTAGGTQTESAETVAGVPDATTPAVGGSAVLTRRVALGLSVAAVGAAVFAVPRSPASAAFTTRTAMTNNSWTVAVLPRLTLGRASTYGLFAANSVVHGDWLGVGTSIDTSVATSPGTTVSGFWPWDISGSIERNTTVAKNARTDLSALLVALEARRPTAVRAPALSGTVRPGVYASSSQAFTIAGTLTLDAQNDPSAIFIFSSGSLSTADNSRIVLVNGASAKNVYWRATSTITLGAGSTARGTYLAGGNAAMLKGSTLVGRLISLNGTVTVTSATVSLP